MQLGKQELQQAQAQRLTRCNKEEILLGSLRNLKRTEEILQKGSHLGIRQGRRLGRELEMGSNAHAKTSVEKTVGPAPSKVMQCIV